MIFPIVQPVIYRGTVSDLRVSAVDDTAFVDNLDITLGDHISSSWESLASGSVTRANSRISAVDGTAFYDFGSGTNLTDNLGKYLIVKDSTGKAIKGWIKAAGSGETLGSELVDAWVNQTDYAYETFTASGNLITAAINTTGYGSAYKDLSALGGKLFKNTNTITLNSGIMPSFRMAASNLSVGFTFTVNGTSYTTGNNSYPRIAIFTDGNVAANFSLDALEFKQVLTPSTSGCTIVSAKGGATERFKRIDTGFLFNSSSYTVIIKKLRKLYPFNIPDEEVHELWKLYSLGGGASWTNKTGWFTDLDVENWHGITLSGGRVKKIEIPSNNGTGNISSFQPGVFTSMTNLSLSINSFSGDLSSWVLPSSMTVLSLYTNSFSGDLSSWVLPSNMIYLYLYTNSFSGDLSSWVLPSSMIYLYLHTNSFSGDLSSWILPSSMTNLYLYANSFLGVPDISSNTAMRNYQYYSNGLLTATVDAIIDGIWARRMSFTYTTPIILQIGGTNQAATGTEQNVCPPTTPKEKIYQLENDGCAEGFKKWAITNN